MNKQSAGKKPLKPISKKPTVQDPFKDRSFVIPNEEKSLTFETSLREKLEKTFPKQPKIKWGEIVREKLPRRLRREKINQLKQEDIKNQIAEKGIATENQCFFHLGFNTTMKELQNNRVSTVLISSNLPTQLVQVLQPPCEMKNVPLIGLKCLDQLSKDKLGYQCSVMGISNQKDHLFSDIAEIAAEVSKVSNNEIVNDVKTGKVQQIVIEKTQVYPKAKLNEKKVAIRNLHLKRSSTRTRTFVPPSHHDLSGSKFQPPQKKQKTCVETERVTKYLPTHM